MLSQLLIEELRAVAASFVGEGEVRLSDGRTAFLARGEHAQERCRERMQALAPNEIALSGIIDCAPGVYGFVL